MDRARNAMLCRMMRTWILSGVGVVVGMLLLVLVVALRFPARNGDTSRPPRLFHEPYNGIEFRYPATWADVKGARGIADFKGARGCEIAIGGFGSQGVTVTQDLEQLRQDIAHDEHNPQFGQRPTWAGALVPAASYSMTTDKGRGTRQTQWESVLPNPPDFIITTETMQEGDAGCLTDLHAFEQSLRLFPRDRSAN